MLKAQKRHQSPCTRAEWDQRSCAGKGAKCPILIIGTLNGNRVRLSTAKFLPPEKARDLEAARDLAILWERVGSTVRPEEYTPVPTLSEAAPEPTLPRWRRRWKRTLRTHSLAELEAEGLVASGSRQLEEQR